MSKNYFTINGIQCITEDENGELVIDLRLAGFVENSVPRELLDYPKIKKILLFHKNVCKFLKCGTLDKLGRSLSLEVFDECSDDNPFRKFQIGKCLWKTCQIESNQHGIIHLDIRCDVLSGERSCFSLNEMKLRQLVLRDYQSGVLARGIKSINEDLEELVIADGEPGQKITVNVGRDAYDHSINIESFPEVSLQGITLETSKNNIPKLQDSSKCSTVVLEGMRNLKRLLLSGNGKKILPTGMDQLNNLQELFIYDNPICDQFQSLCITSRLQKLILFNCGIKAFPSAIGQMKELEVLEFCFNDFYDQELSLDELSKLKRLVIFSCNLNTYPVNIDDSISLIHLNLSYN